MTLPEVYAEDAWRRRDFAAVVAACAVFVVPIAVFAGFDPGLCISVVFLMGVLGAILAWLGVCGAVVVGMTAISFLLMNRFDEGWVIPAGHVSIKATYWMMLLSVGALFCHIFFLRLFQRSPLREIDQFTDRFAWRWWGFVLLGLAAIPVNHLADEYVVNRYWPGELLALGLISLPMTFAIWIPLSNLSRTRTLWCLRGLVCLGGLAGVLMTIFGVMPDYMLGRLGWTNAIGGTSDLVRGRLPLGHPNAVAAVMLLLMPVSVIQALGGPRIWLRFFYGGCALAMFCGVLFTLSRSAMLNMCLVFAITLAYLVFAKENRQMWTLLVLAAFAMILLVVAGYLFARYDFSRFWSHGYHEDASVSRRTESVKMAMYVWWDHPLWGVSPDAVYTRLGLRPGWTPRIEDEISPIIYYRGHRSAETPHNLYLTVIAEFGLLGAFLFFGILFTVGRTLLRARNYPGIGFYEKKLLTGLLIGLLAFMMAGMFEAILMVGVRVTIVFWLVTGLALRYGFLVMEDAKRRNAGDVGDQTPLC